ncbi:M1 family metallopeptidase [Streptomyces sp. JJ36]|uniref:M1 family metallopeptidase n=1 Tax=Streptomyces sp. JJ36 TaxID=2736645 RepID=UPI001F344AAD|nr:M1 family metallopeptidase [Streptomyces sp. JJ36]MCF6523927.1 M1 family metallopeptidase [Streptomyces sp. JJ36]
MSTATPAPGTRPGGPGRPRTLRRRTAAALASAAVTLSLVAAAVPGPRALGVGDRLFPALGNPGYDVRAYHLAFRYGGDHDRPLRARTRITARVTADRLERVNLDFSGGEVRSARIAGRDVRHTTVGEDLVLTPDRPLRRGALLRVDIRHTSPTDGSRGGWVRTRDGLVMANQADAAHRVFPCNDHPSDKARFTFRLTAPRGVTAVANGVRTGARHTKARTTWTYTSRHPMATELAQVSLGRSDVVRAAGPHGLPLRHVVPSRHRAGLEPWLARTPGQLRWLERRLGRYPFETYGLLVADARTGFALETQTLSLFERRLFAGDSFPDWYRESVMVHELAHQWFGNSVAPRRWADLWLNEGHATWYEWHYAEHRGGTPVAERMRRAYARSDEWRERYGPPADPRPLRPGDRTGLFRKSVYDGSALVLYALREEVGTRDFRRLQRAWTARHRDGVAGTRDFVRLAEEVSGRDLDAFFRGWLHGERTPPMPGHPQWRTRKSG